VAPIYRKFQPAPRQGSRSPTSRDALPRRLQLREVGGFGDFDAFIPFLVGYLTISKMAAWSVYWSGAVKTPTFTSGRSSRSFIYYKSRCRKRNALAITETELRLIAALAIIGLSSTPETG